MKFRNLLFIFLSFTLLIYGCKEKPSVPEGLGYEFIVDIPSVSYPLPVLYHAANNSDNLTRYTAADNPIVEILYGFMSIWTHGNTDWYTGGVDSSNGLTDFSNEEILEKTVWRENIQYVIDVCDDRTEDQALAAYYDDVRGHNYTVLDGLGPLAEAYKEGSGATTTIDHAFDGFDVNEEIKYEENDEGVDGGTSESELGAIYDLVYCLRQADASTSGSKYFYLSPRPWRMNNEGEVVPLDEDNDGIDDTETMGTEDDLRTYAVYESSVKVVPALKYIRRHEENGGRGKDGGYPSGHTNAAYLASIAYAYAVPERFSEMLTRASQVGENRILAGMHSPLDVMGGRLHSLAVAAAALSNENNDETKNAAYEKAREYFGHLADEAGMTLYEFAHTNDTSDWSDHDVNKALYRERMAYGFTQDSSAAGADPVVPEGAETLLETRLPYLTADQRRAVLYTTEIDSGYPVLDDSNGWGRLDYVTAADGYGAFLGDVTVTMDANRGGFYQHGWWRNDIYGEGLLTKKGNGILTLTGDNSYRGGTLLEEGTLEAESTTAFGNGDVYIVDGTMLVDTEGSLQLSGDFTMDDGTLDIIMDDDSSQITVHGTAYLDGGSLNLDFSAFQIKSGTDITLMTAGAVCGEFENVIAEGYAVRMKYNRDSIIAHVLLKNLE
jgi:autotransporter-associated beta strand protein